MQQLETAPIGHNKPPEPSPFEASETSINDLFDEAKLWLDGETIDRQELADDISKLLNLIRDARKAADASRKTENKPFDDGKTEVQGRYNPLLKKADLASETCKKALAPWLDKLDKEKKAAAEKARTEADAKQRAAQEAIRAADHDNLEEREHAEALLQDAKSADKAANRAAHDTAKASGGTGKAVSLRSTWHPVLKDPTVAARHYWQVDRAAMEEFLTGLAGKDVRAGKREIPGFEVFEERKAV